MEFQLLHFRHAVPGKAVAQLTHDQIGILDVVGSVLLVFSWLILLFFWLMLLFAVISMTTGMMASVSTVTLMAMVLMVVMVVVARHHFSNILHHAHHMLEEVPLLAVVVGFAISPA